MVGVAAIAAIYAVWQLFRLWEDGRYWEQVNRPLTPAQILIASSWKRHIRNVHKNRYPLLRWEDIGKAFPACDECERYTRLFFGKK